MFLSEVNFKESGRELLVLGLICFLTGLIYWSGLSGDFFLDDYPHIAHNISIRIHHLDIQSLWTAANSTSSGPLGRPIALASFALNYYFNGLNPFYFKLTNLVIHLLTGIGIFFLIRQIALRFTELKTASAIALVTTTLWLIHPLNVSTVLYAVQRMTGMAGMLTIWGMVAYCHGRQRLIESRHSGWGWILLGFIIGGIALFAKETAVLMLGYLLVIEWLVFRFQMPSKYQRQGLQLLYAIIVGLPLLWALTTHLFAPGWTENAYAKRSFTLEQRLLTEVRVLWDYLYLTWLPNIQAMGLFHDGYRISRGLFDPITTFYAVSAHVLLIGTSIAMRKRWPLLIFAVAWFYVGHSAESTILPLEIKYEHRNYLPMLGMLLLLVDSIYRFTARLQNSQHVRGFILIAVTLTFGGSTVVRASQFGDFWGFSGMEAEHHPESSRANQNAAVSIMKLMMQTQKSSPELVTRVTELLRRSANADPNSAAPLFTVVVFLPEITHRPASNAFIDDLAYRLKNSVPDANTNSYFSALLRQAENGKLMLSADQVHMLFEQAEANPLIRKGTKADIIAARAAYAQSIEHDNAKARIIIDRALATDPTRSGIHVPAVWIYQEAGMWQDADRLLERLKLLDIYGIEKRSIEWLTKRQIKHS